MRRIISMILLLALVIGLLPGIAAPAQALEESQPKPFAIFSAAVQSKPLNLSGTDYNNAIKFSTEKNTNARVVYNLKGRYETLSFWAGYHSGNFQNATVEVLDDNGTIYTTTVGYEDIAKQHTVSVKGVSKLMIRISTSKYGLTYIGLGDIQFNPGTADPTDPIRKSDDCYDASRYQLQNAKVITDTFSMGGYNYQNGYKLSTEKNNDAKVLFNFKGNYKKMTFDFAKILNDPVTNNTNSAYLTITVDGTVLDDYNKRHIWWNDISLPVTLDLEGVQQVSICVSKNEYGVVDWGMGNIQLVSDGRVQGITLAASAVTLTSSNPNFFLNPQVYPSDAKNKNFTLTIDPTDVAILKDDNIVYGRSNGTAVVTATTEDGGFTATCVINSQLPAAKDVYRVSGYDRYATAFKAADELKSVLGVDKFQNIVVACGTNFPDALAGTYLAAQKSAPILLVRSKNIDQVNEYVKNNLVSGGTLYLLGSQDVVSGKVGQGIAGINVKRLGGATRYDTNLAILKEVGIAGKDIIVCTGSNFADSLSASAVGLPILLVKDGLTATQKEFLNGSTGNFIIIGGTNAVSETVEKQLKTYGRVERLAGTTRYESSVLVAERFFRNPSKAVLAYAQNFPDGLSGGPLAYALKAPMILCATKKYGAAVGYTTARNIKEGYVMGGKELIGDAAVRAIFNMDPANVIFER